MNQHQQNEATVNISDRRLAANRANAALSTGPRTQAGNAASSRNAVSHGLTASKLTIFHWESQDEYAQLRSDYFTRFCPIDTSESDVVDRLVDSTWRRRRALVIETTIFDMEISLSQNETLTTYGETADGPLHLATAFRNRHGEGVWDAIQRLLNAVDCSYSRALRDLEKLQTGRFNILPPSSFENPVEEEDPVSCPTAGQEQEHEAKPSDEPAPDPEAAVPPRSALAPLSSQNKIIEITKQTQPKPATPAFDLVGEAVAHQNEPTSVPPSGQEPGDSGTK
jgi:hypothetical protein